MCPSSAPNSTRCPVRASCATEIRGRSTPAIWNRREQARPSGVRKAASCWPRFGRREPLAARYRPPARCMGDSSTRPGSSPGGATVSSAPLSTTAVTARQPSLAWSRLQSRGPPVPPSTVSEPRPAPAGRRTPSTDPAVDGLRQPRRGREERGHTPPAFAPQFWAGIVALVLGQKSPRVRGTGAGARPAPCWHPCPPQPADRQALRPLDQPEEQGRPKGAGMGAGSP